MSTRPSYPRRAGIRRRGPRGAAGGHDSSLMTFGVKPTYPASSYGYISPNRYRTERRYARSKLLSRGRTLPPHAAERYLWNSGYMFRAEMMLRELSPASRNQKSGTERRYARSKFLSRSGRCRRAPTSPEGYRTPATSCSAPTLLTKRSAVQPSYSQ